MTALLRHMINPKPALLAGDAGTVLQRLQQPTMITLTGRDDRRCRVVTTLLHGNEPSGFKALLRYIVEGHQPRVTSHFFVVSVATALRAPLFTFRQLPGERDMNRTFRPPFSDGPGELAREILARIDSLAPEAVIDIHNTSGEGPAFAVSPVFSPVHESLTHYFTHRMVVTDLRLGSLMETNTTERPAITIECGGANSTMADSIAFRGLKAFCGADRLFPYHSDERLDLYHHPVRLELAPAADIRYQDRPHPQADITLPTHVDKRNFGVVTPEVCLGWVTNADCLYLRNGNATAPIDGYFTVRDGRLHPAVNLKLFMVTTRAEIARSDCLMYAVKDTDHDILHLHGGQQSP